jgi:predicted trehalose synthase
MSLRGEQDISHAAATAAVSVAKRFTATPITPVVLHCSRHTMVLLQPTATVARVLRLGPARTAAALDRELAIARHLGARGAPVVSPSDIYPAGPHVHGDFAMTLWPHVAHVEVDDDNVDQIADAARALHRVHEALADLPCPLPSYMEKIEACGALLASRSELPALAPADRDTLLRMYEGLTTRLARCPVQHVPIHGDAHLGNVLFGPDGPLWTDFETVCTGPREWDIVGVPHLAAFEPVDPECYAVLSLLRSLCVSTWCWASPHLPGKLDAARYHLSLLKNRMLP